MRDRWHQPARGELMPHVPLLIDAALAAGAHGACLAGAGPSVLAALHRGRPRRWQPRWAAAAGSPAVAGHPVTYAVRNFGARVDLAHDAGITSMTRPCVVQKFGAAASPAPS